MLGVELQLGLVILQQDFLLENLLLHFMERIILIIKLKNFTTQLW